MTSTKMKTISYVFAILGVIATIITATEDAEILDALGLSVAIIIVVGIISTAFYTAILLAIAKILEYAEDNNAMLCKLNKPQNVPPSGASNSRVNLSEIASKPTADGWRCPKCGKTNPNNVRICKDCEYQK